jgi:hypothetical protein
MPLKPNYSELKKLRELIPRHGFYLSVDLASSPAYLDLHESSRALFYHFAIAAKFDWVKGEKHHRNNGRIGFPESEFRKYYDCVSQTYYNARDQLIKNGFIKQTRQGGYGPKDYATYKLLFLPDVPKRERRWEKYPEKNWEHEIPKSKHSVIGKDTRFKKGVANRKPKATLSQ